MALPAWQREECAALEALFSPPIDALLRPWQSPGDLLAALARIRRRWQNPLLRLEL